MHYKRKSAVKIQGAGPEDAVGDSASRPVDHAEIMANFDDDDHPLLNPRLSFIGMGTHQNPDDGSEKII